MLTLNVKYIEKMEERRQKVKSCAFKTAVLAFIFFFLVALEFCSTSPQKIISKKYPEGFSLKHPQNWQVQVLDKVFIYASAKEKNLDSSFLLVHPFFLEKAQTSLSWLKQNIPRLTQFFAQVKFEKSGQVRSLPDEAAAKFLFQKEGTLLRALTLCSIHEKSGILYVIAAPADAFEAQRERLLAILKSFQFEKPEQPPSKQAQPGVKYLKWEDPVEKAFSLDVPQGWKVEGGTFRRAAVDLVQALLASSPDRKIQIQFNDKDIPAFTIPNPMLARAGFVEGTWYSPGYGVQMLVKRYTPGMYFLKEYLQRRYAPHLSNFDQVSQNDRPDVVSNFNRLYSQFATYGISFTLHAGEAAFRFQQEGGSFIGYGLALTQVVQSPAMPGGTWSVPLLVIYTCPESEADRVQQISSQMFKSIQVNLSWAASQQQLTANVSQIVTQTSQEISNIITSSYWSRQATLDDIHRRFSNYILGMTDVVDPATGEKWKVEADHNYYWRKDYTDLVVGTSIFERPNIDFSSLKEY